MPQRFPPPARNAPGAARPHGRPGTPPDAPAPCLDLVVVVLNYRTPHLVVDCLDALCPQLDATRHRIVVVDNDSQDDSVARIGAHLRQALPAGLAALVESPVNGGFSAGNRLGVAAAAARLYLLVNSDALVRPGAVAALLAEAERHPEAGILSPRLEWPDGRPQVSCFNFPTVTSEFIDGAGFGVITRLLKRHDVPLDLPSAPTEVPWTSFACALVRAEVWRALGGLDDRYFMYYEDVDFCLRARQRGWCVRHLPAARVVHLRGGSSDTKRRQQARRRAPRFLYASRSLYFRRRYGRLGPTLANLAWLLGRLIGVPKERVLAQTPAACERQWRDIWIGALPARSERGSHG